MIPAIRKTNQSEPRRRAVPENGLYVIYAPGLERIHVYVEHHGDLLDHRHGRRHDSHRTLVSERSGSGPSPRHAAFPDGGGGQVLHATA